ncbi:MAG TPA: adenylate/guanylate cyclase domain-containing protein [Polyangiaceae bacterium]|nr:adenylate/guanylate cyclase domain-containing protein [Polyangiaceae bacterium]
MPLPSPPPSVRGLRVWQRFHVRITLLYGAALLAVFIILGVLLYFAGVDAELRGLQHRLRAMAALLSVDLTPPALEALGKGGPEAEPIQRDFKSRVAALCKSDPDVDGAYVMFRTEQAGYLRFITNHDCTPNPDAPPADAAPRLYDARALPVMLRGLEEVAAEDRVYRDAFGTSLSGYAPLRASGEGAVSVGIVGLDVDARRIDLMRERALHLVGGFVALAALLLAPVAFLVGRAVRGPVERVIHASAAIADGHLETRLGLARRDEFGLMAQHFDQMAAGLEERERIRATFGRYLGRDVARALLAEADPDRLGGEEREVVVLFSDLKGYSTLSEHLSPQQIVGVLNTYLEAMTEAIEAERGVYLEFLGDGFLAVFGAPNELPDKEAAAVRCALEMRRRLVELNEAWERSDVAKLWRDRGIARLEARVGLHQGTVVAGNVGSRNQVRYTVIGDAVNVAARLEALNKELGSEILASREVIERLPPDLAERAASRGEHRIKGREQPVRVYAF